MPAIVAAVGHQTHVFVDGGVRTGFDVLKMLSLGAEGVLVGRDIVSFLCFLVYLTDVSCVLPLAVALMA